MVVWYVCHSNQLHCENWVQNKGLHHWWSQVSLTCKRKSCNRQWKGIKYKSMSKKWRCQSKLIITPKCFKQKAWESSDTLSSDSSSTDDEGAKAKKCKNAKKSKWRWSIQDKNGSWLVTLVYPLGPLHPPVPLLYFIPNFPFLAHFLKCSDFPQNSTSTQILNFKCSGLDFKFSFYFFQTKSDPLHHLKQNTKHNKSFGRNQKKPTKETHTNLNQSYATLLHSYWPNFNFFSLFSLVNHNWSLTSTLSLHSWPG